MGAWSNIFQAYRASAKAVKWSGNDSVVGLPRTSWNPLGKVRHTDWIPVRHISEHHLDDTVRGEDSMSDFDSSEDEAELKSSMRRQEVWRRRGEHLDDYCTDSEDSGSDDSYLDFEDLEAYRAAKQADYDADEAKFEALRAKHSEPGYQPTAGCKHLAHSA